MVIFLIYIFIETKNYKETFSVVATPVTGKATNGYKDAKITALVSQLEKDVDEVSLDLRRMKQKFAPVYQLYLELGKEKAKQQREMGKELNGFKKDMSTQMGKELSKVLKMSPEKGAKLMNQFLEKPNLNDKENKKLLQFQKKIMKENLSGSDAKIDFDNSAFANIRKILKKQGL